MDGPLTQQQQAPPPPVTQQQPQQQQILIGSQNQQKKFTMQNGDSQQPQSIMQVSPWKAFNPEGPPGSNRF